MNIEYYETVHGDCPVVDFIESLPAQERVLVMHKIELLAEHGLNLRRPHADILRDGIHELRIRTHHGQQRILYFIFHRDTAVLLCGFTKKSDKVADVIIEKAVAYKSDYSQRHGYEP